MSKASKRKSSSGSTDEFHSLPETATGKDLSDRNGKFANLFIHINDVPKTLPVVGLLRVSTEMQASTGIFRKYRIDFIERMISMGRRMERIFEEVCAGDRRIELRQVFLDALECARKTGSVLVAYSVDRFIRPCEFHPYRFPDASLQIRDYRAVIKWRKGVLLATVLDPVSSIEELGRFRDQLGKMKSEIVWERSRELANELCRCGYSVRRVAALLNVDRRTVGRWVRKE